MKRSVFNKTLAVVLAFLVVLSSFTGMLGSFSFAEETSDDLETEMALDDDSAGIVEQEEVFSDETEQESESSLESQEEPDSASEKEKIEAEEPEKSRNEEESVSEEADPEIIEEAESEEKKIEEETSEKKAEEIPEKKPIKAEKKKVSPILGDGNDNSLLISEFNARLMRGATKNASGDFVWEPESSEKDHGFVYRVSYAMSGNNDFEPGNISFRIPKSILVDRNGNSADSFDLSIPSESEANLGDSANFVYRIDGDEIVITNRLPIPAGFTGYFEIAYLTSEASFEYADYGSSNTVDPKGGSRQFYADIKVVQGKAVKTDEVKGNKVYINTWAKVKSAKKNSTGTRYEDWKKGWGTPASDAEDYYYLIWRIGTTIEATQPYRLDVVDTMQNSDCKVIGYSLNESGPFAESFSEDNCTESGTRSIFVLTAHKKDVYDDLALNNMVDNIQQYTLTNKADVTVTPKDRADASSKKSASASWKYEKKPFEPVGGSISVRNSGYDINEDIVTSSEDIRSYELEDLRLGKKSSLNNLRYRAQVTGNTYSANVIDVTGPAGVPDGVIDELDFYCPEAYGHVPMDFIMTVDEWKLDDEVLAPDDYDISYLIMGCSAEEGVYSEAISNFDISRVKNFTDQDIITVWAEKNGSGIYEPVAQYSLKNDSYTALDARYVSKSNKKTLYFQPGVTSYQLQFSSGYYKIEYGADSFISLKGTDHVKNILEGNSSDISSLTNVASLEAYLKNGDISCPFAEGSLVYFDDRTACDYLKRGGREGVISKTESAYRNDKVARKVYVDWDVTAFEKNKNNDGKVKQISGILYDLLPEGASYKKDSVKVHIVAGKNSNREEIFPDDYTVDVQNNYNGTGRTMLIVHINVPAIEYMMSYTSVHTWDALKDYGYELLNSVAYETGNFDIGDGLPDSGGYIQCRNLMKDLDKDTDDPKFIYAERKFTPPVTTSGNLGLIKTVKGSLDDSYSYNGLTAQNSDYSYYLHLQTDASQKAKDLILYDSLENYIVESGKEAGSTSKWHGLYRNIDLSSVKKQGIDPVVYYSTVANLDISQNRDLNSSVWIKASNYSGSLDDVRAVAIDLRKDTSGKDYVLPVNTGISCTIHMKAPMGNSSIPAGAKAYNNIYMNSTAIDARTDISQGTELVHQDYTTVLFKVLGNILFEKVDSSDHSKKIRGAVFHLYGTSDYGTKVDITKTSNDKGQFAFKELERGTYTMEEIESPDDYLINSSKWKVEIDASGNALVNGSKVDTEPFAIEDEKRIHGDLTLQKKGLIDFSTAMINLAGVSFKLQGVSEYGNKITRAGTTDSDGILVMENIELGTYKLKELATADGYLLPEKEWSVVCDKTGRVYIEGAVIQKDDISEIYNEPEHNLKLKKLDAENTSKALEGAKYSLTGTSSRGTTVNLEAVSDQYGTILFEGLEPGSYVLKEIEAPAHYVLDPDGHAITIESDGKVKGLDSFTKYTKATGYDGYYAVLDERVYEGELIITKSWNDSDPSKRPVPKVVLSNREPENSAPVAQISRSQWDKFYAEFPSSLEKYKKHFQKSDSAPKGTESSLMRIDDGNTEYPIYAWYTQSGSRVTVYWWSEAETVFLPYDCSKMFYDGNYSTVNFGGLDISHVTSFKQMFAENDGINSVLWDDIIDTSNVTDMSGMFDGCTRLSQAGIEKFDTSNVEDMSYMFRGCAFSEIDVSGFDTSNVRDMRGMFQTCKSIGTLDISGFDTSKVGNMESMFAGCAKLTTLELGDLDTSNVRSMKDLFAGDLKLADLDVSCLETQNVESMEQMFMNCVAIKSLDLSNFNTCKVKSMAGMFRQMGNIEELDLSSFNTANVSDMTMMFFRDIVIMNIFASDEWSIASISDPSAMQVFSINNKLIGGNKTSYSPSTQSALYAQLDIEGRPGLLRYKAHNPSPAMPPPDPEIALLKEGPELNTIFKGLGDAVAFQPASKVPSGVSTVEIQSADSLEPVYAWYDNGTIYWYSDAPKVYLEDSASMFSGMSKLKSIDFGGLDTTRLMNMNSMFHGCSSLEEVNLELLETSWVKDMTSLFEGCSSLERIDLTTWYTGDIAKMSRMFKDCTKLQTIYVEDRWTTGAVTDDGASMFEGDTALFGGDGTKYASGDTGLKMAVIDGKNDAKGYLTSFIPPVKLRYTNTLNPVMKSDLADPDSVYEHWIDNGDGTWTYRFKVFEEDMQYYIWESSAPGYVTDQNEKNPIILQYIANKKGQNAAILNSKEPTTTGGLIVSKTLKGSGITKEDENREYEFKVTLKDESGQSDGITGKFGEMIFKDGIAHIKVGADKSVAAADIPEGYTYTVEEENADDYVVTSTGETGTIVKDEICMAGFTNTKEKSVGSLKIEKVLESGDPKDSFLFLVKLSGPKIGGNQIFGSTAFSDGEAKVSLKGGESLQIENIPSGTEYSVEELYSFGYELATCTDETGTIQKDKEAEAVFTNREVVMDEGGFTLMKKVAGKDTDETFNFEILFDGLAPGKTYQSSRGDVITATASGSASYSVGLKDGGSVTFAELPIDATYMITEKSCGYIASYEITDANNMGCIEKENGENKVKDKEISTDSETVDKDESILVTFTNRPVMYPVTIGKVDNDGELVDGAKLKILSDKGKTLYEFESSNLGMVSFDLVPGSYTLHEESAPDGYLEAKDIVFDIDEDGTVRIGGDEKKFITMEDKKTKVKVIKEDPKGNRLQGASLAIYEASDVDAGGKVKDGADPVYSFASKDVPEEIEGVLKSGGEYVLVETSAPLGYKEADPIPFTVPDTEDPLTLTMVDDVNGFYVPVAKYDGDGKPLAGAELEILEAKYESSLKKWVSGNTAEEFLLGEGYYILREVAVPDEKIYLKAWDIYFRVTADGKVLVDGQPMKEVAMVDSFVEKNNPVPPTPTPDNPSTEPDPSPVPMPEPDPVPVPVPDPSPVPVPEPDSDPIPVPDDEPSEIEEEPPVKDPGGEDIYKEKQKVRKTVVETGDVTNGRIWLILMILSLTGGIAALVCRRREEK